MQFNEFSIYDAEWEIKRLRTQNTVNWVTLLRSESFLRFLYICDTVKCVKCEIKSAQM